MKETENFLQELNESLDQPESNEVQIEDETESCNEVMPEPTKEESNSLLDSAWKIFSLPQPLEGEERPGVLQDTLRMFGLVKTSSDAPIEKSEMIDTAGTETIDEIADTKDTDVYPTEVEEVVVHQYLAAREGHLPVAEISSVPSTQKKKTRGLLMRRSRRKMIELEVEEDLASQFVPLVDDEGVQIIPTDSGAALSSDEKTKSSGKRDKVTSIISRIKRKAERRRKEQIVTSTQNPEVEITNEEAQM